MRREDFQYCPRCGKSLPEGRETPLICKNKHCGHTLWFNPTPVVAVLCQHSGGIVLAHNKSWRSDVLGAITGFIESEENPVDAAIRETREELGITLTDPALIGAYSYPPMNQIIIAYHGKAEGRITLGEELDRYKIIAMDKLKPWSFGTGLAVADLLKRYRDRSQNLS